MVGSVDSLSRVLVYDLSGSLGVNISLARSYASSAALVVYHNMLIEGFDHGNKCCSSVGYISAHYYVSNLLETLSITSASPDLCNYLKLRRRFETARELIQYRSGWRVQDRVV